MKIEDLGFVVDGGCSVTVVGVKSYKGAYFRVQGEINCSKIKLYSFFVSENSNDARINVGEIEKIKDLKKLMNHKVFKDVLAGKYYARVDL